MSEQVDVVAVVLRDQLHAANSRERKLLLGLTGMLREPQIEADTVRHILTVALFGGETWQEDDLDTFSAIREMVTVHGLPREVSHDDNH